MKTHPYPSLWVREGEKPATPCLRKEQSVPLSFQKERGLGVSFQIRRRPHFLYLCIAVLQLCHHPPAAAHQATQKKLNKFPRLSKMIF